MAVAIGNWLADADEPSKEAGATLIEALRDNEPLVRGHAAWAPGRIGSGKAGEALADALNDEGDEHVRQELEHALR